MLQGLNLRLQAHTPLGIQLTLNAHLVKGWECGTRLYYKLLLSGEPCIDHHGDASFLGRMRIQRPATLPRKIVDLVEIRVPP